MQRGFLAAVFFIAILVSGCTAQEQAGAARCSPDPEDTTRSMGGLHIAIDAAGAAEPWDRPPLERGIPFSVAVVANDAPDQESIRANGGDLVVRDVDGTDLYRRHADVEADRPGDDLILDFDPVPCYRGASYDFDYAGRSVPLGIQISDAAACSDRPSDDGDEWGLLQVRDDVLWEGDWELGPQPFAVMVSWYPPPAGLRPEETSVVVRVDGDVVDRVRGWPHNEEGSTAVWFEQIPCIQGAEYSIEYPGHSLPWRPNLQD